MRVDFFNLTKKDNGTTEIVATGFNGYTFDNYDEFTVTTVVPTDRLVYGHKCPQDDYIEFSGDIPCKNDTPTTEHCVSLANVEKFINNNCLQELFLYTNDYGDSYYLWIHVS